jgi:hypothetical protein
MFVNQVLPVLLAFGIAARWMSSKGSVASVGIALAMLMTVVMTFSRAGMVLSLMTILGVLLVANRKAGSIRVSIVSIVVVAGLGLGLMVTGRSIVERFMEAPEASHLAREEFNRAAKAMAQDNPLGVGINQFSYVLTNTPKYSDYIRIMAAEKQKGVCHEVYNLTAAEMGWIGLAVFVLVILRFLWHASFEAFRKSGFEGLLQAALAMGMAALHLSGFLEWVFRITPIFFLFLVCCGLSVGLADVSRLDRRARRVGKGGPGGREIEAAKVVGKGEADAGVVNDGPQAGTALPGRRITGEWVPVQDPAAPVSPATGMT